MTEEQFQRHKFVAGSLFRDEECSAIDYKEVVAELARLRKEAGET